MIEPYWTSADGRFVIYCGDCMEVLPTLGKVDAVVTDPPYGIAYSSGKTGHNGGTSLPGIVGIKRELSQPRLALEEQPTFEQREIFEAIND